MGSIGSQFKFVRGPKHDPAELWVIIKWLFNIGCQALQLLQFEYKGAAATI